LTDITEYGDVMISTLLDEWGRRRIDGVLEDGTRVIIAAAVVVIAVGDSGVGIEDVTVFVAVTDTSTGTDGINLSTTISTIDVGFGVEVVDLNAMIFADDTGTGTDFSAAGIHQPVDDAAVGVDSISMVMEVLDTGSGIELVNTSRQIFDAGSGADIINSPQFNVVGDAGAGSEAVITTIPQSDSGTGSDAVDTVKMVDDAGIGIDSIPILSREVLESSVGFETVSRLLEVVETSVSSETVVVDSTEIITVQDFAAGVDAIGLVSVVSVIDAGIGVELAETQLSIYGLVTLDNNVIVGVHSIPYRDLARDGLPIQTQRRFVDDRVYVGGVEVGVVTVEWEDKVADIVSGVRTVRVAGVVRLVE
jgi:hypothetical protein